MPNIVKRKKLMIIYVSVIVITLIAISCIVLHSSLGRRNRISLSQNKLKSGYIKIVEVADSVNVYSQFYDTEYTDKAGNNHALGKALHNNIISIDELAQKSSGRDALNDGGTMIYYFNNHVANRKFKIVKCQTLAGVKDIYFVGIDKDVDNLCVER